MLAERRAELGRARGTVVAGRTGSSPIIEWMRSGMLVPSGRCSAS